MNELYDTVAQGVAQKQARAEASVNIDDAFDVNPDEHAKTISLAKQSGLPAAVVADDPKAVERDLTKNEYMTFLDDNPRLVEWMRDPDAAKLSSGDRSLFLTSKTIALQDVKKYAKADETPWLSKAGDQLRSGAINLGQGVAVGNIRSIAGRIAEFDKIDQLDAMDPVALHEYHAEKMLETAGAPLDPVIAKYLMHPKERAALREGEQGSARVYQDHIKETTETKKTLHHTPESPDFMRLLNSDKPEDNAQAWAIFRSNPFGIIQQIGLESLPQMAPGLALMAATGLPVPSMFVGSAFVEHQSSTMEGLEKAGVDVTTPEGIEKLKDREFMKPILQKADLRSMIVGGFDGVSGGLASKVLVPAFRSTLARHAANLPAQMGAQAVMGGAGEAAAQLATDGKLSWGDVWAEVFGEFVSAPGEVAGASWAVRGERAAARINTEIQAVRQAVSGQETGDALADAAGQSRLRERSPEHYADFINSQVAGTQLETVSIPAEQFVEYFQSVNVDPFSLVEDEAFSQQIYDALAVNGDITMDSGTFYARLAEHYAGLRDHICMGENSYTPAEAAEIQASLDQDIEARAEALLAEMEEERAARAPGRAVYDDVFSQLRVAGRPEIEAKQAAALYQARYETRASRLGADAYSLYSEKPLRIVREQGIFPANEPEIDLELFQRGEVDESSMARALRVDPETDTRVHDVASRFTSYEEGHAWLKTHEAREALKGPVTNELTGETIEITASGIAHAVGSNIRSGRKTPARMEAIAAWRELLTHAVPAGPYAAREKDAHMLDGIHNYYAAMRMNGETYLVRMMVRQFKEERSQLDGLSVFRVHDTKTSSLQISSDLHSVSQTTDPPVEGSTVKVRDLLKGIKGPDGKELFQGVSDPKGSIRFSDSETIISLFQKADKSTFLHESGHLFFNDLAEDAFHVDAPMQLQNDLVAALEFAGVTLDLYSPETVQAALTTDVHEKLARAFEAYLREGNAPSVGLQRVFKAFKAWLMRIYKSVRGLNVDLTPEIRDVMDRMLATDEQIQEARTTLHHEPVIQSEKQASQAGISPEEYQKYLKEIEHVYDQQHSRLLARAMRELEERKKEEYFAERDAIKTEVEKEVLAMPLHRAAYFLKTGGFLGTEYVAIADHFLDRDALADIVGKANLKEFSGRYRVEGGLHPDLVAEQMGFNSGEQMVRALMGDRRRVSQLRSEGDRRSTLQYDIDTLTDQRMNERHGDMLNDGTIEEEALAIAHEGDYGKVLLRELKYLRRAMRKGVNATVGDVAQYRKAAEKTISRRTVADVTRSENWYRRAEIRAAKQTERAVADGDFTKAAHHKNAQVMNFYLAIAARDATAEVQKAHERFAKLKRKDEKLSKGMDVDYAHAAQAVLHRYGLFGETKFDLNDFFSAIRQDPDRAEAIQTALDLDIINAKPFKELTLDSFRDVADAVDNLMAAGRNERRMSLDWENVTIDDAAQALAVTPTERMSGRPDKPESPPTTLDHVIQGALGMRAHLTRLETWTRGMDSEAHDGAWTKYFYNPLRQAETAYMLAKGNVLERLHTVLEPLRGTLHERKIAAPELGFVFPNKEQLLSALLHIGNESNRERLIKGYGWSEQGWDSFLGRMYAENVVTKREMDTIQGVWDLFESVKPEIQAAHREMYGFNFGEVQAEEVITPWGKYRGGYAPVIYEQSTSVQGAIRSQVEAEGQQLSGSAFASTGRGATKARQDHKFDPLYLGSNSISRHVDWAMRFIHLQPAVRQAGRLLKKPDLVRALSKYDQHAVSGVLQPALRRIAQQSLAEPTTIPGLRGIGRLANFVRVRSGQFIMVGYLVNAMQQITGFSSALALVEGAHLRRAFTNLRHADVRASIFEKSDFMTARIKEKSRTMAHAVERDTMDQTGVAGAYNKVGKFVDQHGYIFQSVAQLCVDMPVWLGAYDQAITKGLTETDAILEADSVVRRTQGSFDPGAASAVEAGGALKRLFTMFYTYFNTQGNLFFGKGATIIRETKGAARAQQLAYLSLVVWWIPAILADAITQGLRGDLDDAEDWLTLAATSPLKFLTAMIPGGGHFLNAGASRAWNGKASYGDKMSLSPVLNMAEGMIGAFSAFRGEGATSRSIKDTSVAISLITGVPLGQVSKTLGFIADVEEGRAQVDDVQDYLFGLLSGRTGKK